MTVIGGVLGVLGGIGAAKALTTMVGWPTIVSWQAMAAAFFFSVTVGLFFGLYPAKPLSGFHRSASHSWTWCRSIRRSNAKRPSSL